MDEAAVLGPDETVLVRRRRRGLSILDDILLMVVAVGVAAIAYAVLRPLRPLLADLAGAAVLVLSLWFLVVRIWRLRTTRYILTASRVYRMHGRLRFFLSQTTFDKVTDLHTRQSLWGRRFGFGTVIVRTAGAAIALSGVDDPLGLKDDIESSRARYLASFVTKKAAPEVAAAPPAATRHWQGRPSGSWTGVHVVIPAILLVVGTLLLLGSLLNPALAFVGLGVVVLAGARLAAALIQARYSQFEVTDIGVRTTTGWLSRRTVETTYAKVTDVTTSQDILGRVFGYGEIRINTAGSEGAPVVFVGIATPERVKALIEELRGKA